MTIIKKFETTEPKKGFSKRYIVLRIVCLFVLMLVEIWAGNNVVAYGEKFDKLSTIGQKKQSEDLNLSGIGFQQASTRFYPEGSSSAHLLGFLGSDAKGENKGYFGL